MTSEEQLILWVDGVSKCPNARGECCPDFSCCKPVLLVSKRLRIIFKKSDQAERQKMLFGFLGALLSKGMDDKLKGRKVYLTGGSQRK